MTTATRYQRHQYLNCFECSTCSGNGETALLARCPGCKGTGIQSCLLRLECDGDDADVISAHDGNMPACAACEARCEREAAVATRGAA